MGSFHTSETSSESAPPPVYEAMIRDLKVLVPEPSKFSVLLRSGFYQLMHRGKPPADLPSLCTGAPPLPIPQHGLYHLQGPLVGSPNLFPGGYCILPLLEVISTTVLCPPLTSFVQGWLTWSISGCPSYSFPALLTAASTG